MAAPLHHSEKTAAPALPSELVRAGLGADAWRFLRRLTERRTFVRVARRTPEGRHARTLQVVKVTPGPAFRVLLEAPLEAGVDWIARGFIEPARQVPGVVAYWRVTPAGRRAEADMRPATEHEPVAGTRPRRDVDGPANSVRPRRKRLVEFAKGRAVREASL